MENYNKSRKTGLFEFIFVLLTHSPHFKGKMCLYHHTHVSNCRTLIKLDMDIIQLEDTTHLHVSISCRE